MPGYKTLDEERTTSGYGEISRIERDVARRATRVTALNARGTQYPWGTKRFHESIVHEAQDDHPEAASVRGEYETTVVLPGPNPEVGERGHLQERPRELLLQVRPAPAQGRRARPREDLGGHDSPRSPVTAGKRARVVVSWERREKG